MLILPCPGLARPLKNAYAEFGAMVLVQGTPLGPPEMPPGASVPDPKLYLEFDERSDGIPAALKGLRNALIGELDRCLQALSKTSETFLHTALSHAIDRHSGPVLRMTWYPNDYVGEVNQPHTDIDLFTILPPATLPGLERRLGDAWLPIDIGEDEIAVLPGEILQILGGAHATEHRVIGTGVERISASLFVNADPSLVVDDNVRVGDLMRQRFLEVRRPLRYQPQNRRYIEPNGEI